MSGGHWDYSQYRLEEYLQNVGNDGQVVQRFPTLAKVLLNLGTSLSQIVHDLDWDISNDTSIKDDRAFEDESLFKLHNAIDEPMFSLDPGVRELIKTDLAQHRKNTMFSPGYKDKWVRLGFPPIKGLDRMTDMEIILEYVAALEPEQYEPGEEVPDLLRTLRGIPGFAAIEAAYMKGVKNGKCQ